MYKVLRKENGNLVSCVMGKPGLKFLHDWKITYPPNKWVKPKIGKVIVCKTLNIAKQVFDTENAHEIWRCQTRKTVEIKKLISFSEDTMHLFIAFWMHRKLPDFDYLIVPFRSYGADKIKLTKKVWPK